MAVTIQNVKRTIESLYQSNVSIVEGGTVVFQCLCGDYSAHISLRLTDQFATKGTPQALGISMVLAKKDGDEYSVNHHDDGLLATVCMEQQRLIDWSSIEVQLDGPNKFIVLYRMIDITTYDLQKAKVHLHSSTLHSSLHHMFDELNTIAPAIISLAQSEASYAKQTHALLNLPTDGTGM